MLTVILDASLMGPPVRVHGPHPVACPCHVTLPVVLRQAPIKRSMQHPFHELRNGPTLQACNLDRTDNARH